jgi:hypothetical protein
LSRIFIIGFGKVGREILPWVKEHWSKDKVWIIDHDPSALTREKSLHGLAVLADGLQFLTRYQDWIRNEDWIIPALPIHLAWHWLTLNLKASLKVQSIRPETRLGAQLPYKSYMGHGLLVSYADFVCPDRCPAPIGRCYKTRRTRPLPLWRLLETKSPSRGILHVIESRQMAPGMGGYPFSELRKVLARAIETGPPFFVATACRCHGVINGLTWRPGRTLQER